MAEQIVVTYRQEVALGEEDRRTLARIERLLRRIVELENIEMASIADIQDEVSQETDVVSSVVTLLSELHAELESAKDDPAAIQSVLDQLASNRQALADAVTANTPDAGGGGDTPPTPAPEPPPAP